MTEESLQYLNRKLTEEYKKEGAEEIFAGFKARRRTSLRANTLKTTVDDVKEALFARGIPYEEVRWNKAALVLPPDAEKEVQSLPAYEKGEIYLQSLSSMLPPFCLDLTAGENLLDMAAAPGGKTTQVAAMSANTVNITACERAPMRAERLKYNLQKQGAKRVNVMVLDARRLDEFFSFDEILLDAPCSGSGTVDFNDGHKKAAFNDSLLKKLADTQLALLKKALKLLKPGKSMVYSTCSLFKEENERVIAAATKDFPCETVPLSPSDFAGAKFLPSETAGALTILPDEYYEGFFVAKIRKKG